MEGVVRERSSKNANLPTGEIEVVPDKIEILGKCIYNALPFEINQSKDADENARLKYRYLDLRLSLIHILSGMQAGVGAVIASVTYDMGAPIVKEKDPMSLVIMLGAFLAACILAVSYTHLDVYKRQRMSSPNAAFGVFLVVFVLYFFACWPFSVLARVLEKKWN